MSHNFEGGIAIMWTIAEAFDFIKVLYPVLSAVGWGVGITGGVLVRGQSAHDLDLVFYPLNKGRMDLEELYWALKHCGLSRLHDVATTHQGWRLKGSTDCKHVEVWNSKDNKRVDIIILS